MKIGIFFSRSNGVTDAAIDIKSIAHHFSKDYFTLTADDFFKASDLGTMLKEITKNSLDAVVLAGDSPLSYQNKKSARLVIDEIEARGINANKIGIANIKEHVAMAHPASRVQATAKAKALVQVAVEKVKLSPPIMTRDIAPQPAVAIFGATPGGMLAAQRLLERDFRVYLIDQAPQPRPFSDKAKQDMVQASFAAVELNSQAEFMPNARVNDIYGHAGCFTVRVTANEETRDITVGSIVVANTGDRDFAGHLRPLVHLDIDEEGLFRPVNPETQRVLTNEQGIFLLPDDETRELSYIVALSDSAALAVTWFLDQKEISHKVMVSDINEELCSGCGTCVKTCLFRASGIDVQKKVSVINEQRCKGCGNCVTSCPAGARDLFTYPQKYLARAIDILSGCGEAGKPKIMAFLCEGCGYSSLDLAGVLGINYGENVMPLGIRCGGNIDTQLILESYSRGFDGVVICKCPDTDCRNIVGNTDLDRRANLFREVLRSRGIDADSLRIVEGYSGGTNTCVQAMARLYEELIESNEGGK